MASADGLCVGDSVCLYAEEGGGFVTAYQTSSVFADVAIYPRQSRTTPDIPDPQVITFELRVANRYKLGKRYRTLEETLGESRDDHVLRSRVECAQMAAKAETEDNIQEQLRQQGKPVLYGMVVQLRHVFTNKFLHVSTTLTSHTEAGSMKVTLADYNARHAQFRVMPRYKVKAEGDLVYIEDQIVLESVKSPGQYLHTSKAFFPAHSVYMHLHELSLSVRQSGFTVYSHHRPDPNISNMVKAGAPLRLFHKELEANLVAEGLFDHKLQEDVHLRVRPVDQANPKTLFPSTSAITYWQIELAESPIHGSVLRWQQQVRLRHLATRRHLVVDNGAVSLTTNPTDPKSVFRLHPVIKEKDQIEYETFCRIEHVMSKSWLHALTVEYIRQEALQATDGKSMASLIWTKAPLKQLSVSEEMMYDDAFTIQQIETEDLTNFNYMAGMVPFIQKVTKDKSTGVLLTASRSLEVVDALRELKHFMVHHGEPQKRRQKLLRNLRMVELLVQILQLPYKGAADQSHLTAVMVECYDVMYTYLMGDSRKNELYIAKNIDFFNSQISYEGPIGLNAAHMVMELVRDNRKIVDRITHAHIDLIIDLLYRNKNHWYLDLLSVLCVCDGVSIPDNQTYITDVWLKQKHKGCVYHTELGDVIKRTPEVVYLSLDGQHSWTSIHQFIADCDLNTDENVLFLNQQLDLFSGLCFGRNEYAISVITEDLKYLTWEEAYLCLTNANLPDQLRAKYCHLIIGLFVDVGENAAVLDRINLTFVYDEVGDGKVIADAYEIARERSITKKYFPVLRDWISNFLDNNKDMTASAIGHNMLVEQVLALVHYLAKFGYYETMYDIKQLLEPLLSLLDGRNDKPYPVVKGNMVLPEELKRYQEEVRYKPSPETKAIVDAKFQAMEVLELFLNHRFNVRLERFVEEFKTTYDGLYMVDEEDEGLHKLLDHNYSLIDEQRTNTIVLATLKEMLQESSFFRGYNLKDVLLDLSHYEYDKMVVKSMSLLNRYFSAHDNLFKRAVQAQVVITPRSVQMLRDLHAMLPTMQRLITAKMSESQIHTMGTILDKLISWCSLEGEPDENHAVHQQILYNHTLLSIVFGILAQDFDMRLMEQYSGLQRIFQKAFMLLKVMARNNDIVQQRLFDRLDMLLNIEGAEPQMAEALTEVFTGNKETCLKVLPHQVQKIMSLAAIHTSTAPQFLDLLNALVKVEDLNLPLKRNQGYVMKYFMQYRSEVAHVIDQTKEDRQRLLRGPSTADRRYMAALIDLLATCAEGENRFIESICQTMLQTGDLLDVLVDDEVQGDVKLPCVRFLLWVYLNTANSGNNTADIPHDSGVWRYLANLPVQLDALTQFAVDQPTATRRLLRRRLQTRSVDEAQWVHHIDLHYVMDGVVPLLQVFFKTHFQPEPEQFPEELNTMDTLTKSVLGFVQKVAPLVSQPADLQSLGACVCLLLPASSLPEQVLIEFQKSYGEHALVGVQLVSEARQQYQVYYRDEQSLNDHLNVFSTNYSRVYGGTNSVLAQIGHGSDREYSEVGGDEELPLGQEFQDHISCFVNKTTKNTDDKYHLTDKLINQLQISESLSALTEKERLNQEALDIKCLQLLRGIIHNQTVRLPEDWESFPKENRKQLVRVEHVQSALNGHSAVLKVLPHLSKTGDDIVREVLAFLAAMLFGGNESVQQSLVDYFLGTREERFFFAVKNRMQLSAIATKEKRSLVAQHQAKVEEALEQTRSLRRAMKASNLATEEMCPLLTELQKSSQKNGKRSGGGGFSGSRISLHSDTCTDCPHKPDQTDGVKQRSLARGRNKQHSLARGKYEQLPLLDDHQGASLKARSRTQTLDATCLLPDVSGEHVQQKQLKEHHDDGYIALLLRIMGLMCDGQNTTVQNYLREQPDNIKSINLVAETAKFLSLLYSNITQHTIHTVIQLINTLVEFTAGNPVNQLVVYDNKVCDYINFILRTASFKECKPREVLHLKKAISILIMTLIEENPDPTSSSNSSSQGKTATSRAVTTIARDVGQSLDSDALWATSIWCYNSAKEDAKDDSEDSLPDDALLSVGLNYYMILHRLQDLIPSQSGRVVIQDSQEAACQLYAASTLSIELIKDGVLQKLYFRCRDKSVLRDDVKQKFKYEVDRSSPTNKLREFMDWSKDIMADIKYTRRVLAHPVSRFFVKYWLHFNRAMLFVSFLFFLVVMVTWREPLDKDGQSDHNSVVPRYAFSPVGVAVVSYILALTHNVLSTCVLISYFLTNHPTLPHVFVRTARKVYHLLRLVLPRPPSRCTPWLPWRHTNEPLNLDDDQESIPLEQSRESNLEVKFFSFQTYWHILLFACSILGTAFYGYFFAFHLLHLAQFNQLLARAIRAVSKNGLSLLWVFVYGLIFIYIYSLLCFAFYRAHFDSSAGLYCTTVYECLVTTFHRGLIVSLFEFLEIAEDEPFSFYLHKALLDVTFFIIITTIGLNIIFGIIVDTFSELRDNKWQIDSDMKSCCFICSRNSYDFEKQGSGFEDHVKYEHNQWAYLFFFIHLDETRPNDYTALEQHVSKLLERESFDFFPLNRALSLQHEENSHEQKLETLMTRVDYLVAKMKEDVVTREREREQLQQQEWERQHVKQAASMFRANLKAPKH